MGPEDLKQTICQLAPTNQNVVVGFKNSEDAAVFQINENEAIVQTLDFITPVVDDPYIYGKIAAANSLSDIFAMGAEVKTAMNIVGFDATHFPKEVLSEILKGGNEKIQECGGVLMGGHTIQTPEMYYGLSVTGMIHPKKVLINNGGKIGDSVLLTKPIGLGILTTAIKNDKLDEKGIREAILIMETLNQKTSQLLSKYKVNACTDITGFGLLGHTLESTRDDISYLINSAAVPIMNNVEQLCKDNVIPGGSKRNMQYLEDKVSYDSSISKALKQILCDAQTSGGLLITMDKEDAKEYLKEIEEISFGYARCIGEVIPRKEKPIIVL